MGIGVPALAALHAGSYYLVAVAALVAGALAWEWRALTAPGSGPAGWGFVGACALAPAVAHEAGLPAGALLCLFAAALGALGGPGRGRSARGWLLGAALAGLAPCCLVALRMRPADGAELVMWLCIVVIAADVGAYAVGRIVGGPRLAPRISPGKTWSGAVGGIACAAAAGVAYGVWAALGGAFALILASVATAVASMAGDLFASAVKRRAGVKDSSRLIPGHGGAMDRFEFSRRGLDRGGGGDRGA